MLRRSFRVFRKLSSPSTRLRLNSGTSVAFRRNFSDYPDHEIIGLPALSPSVETSKIVKWNKAEGDFIAADEVIAVVQTDKAEIDWPSVDEAYLAKILLEEGKEVPINTPACIFVEDSSQVAAFKNYVSGSSSPVESSAPSSPPADSSPTPPPSSPPSGNFPEHSVLTIPALSPTAETGAIVEWLVKEGDEVEANQGIAEVQTDKAVVTWETLDDGYIAKILFPANKDAPIPVGMPALVLVENESSISAFANYTADSAAAGGGSSAPAPSSQPEPSPATTATTATAAPTPAAAQQKSHPSGSAVSIQFRYGVRETAASPSPSSAATTLFSGRVAASPYARSLAKERGVNLQMIGKGSGPGGRIVAKDVLSAPLEQAISAAPSTTPATGTATPATAPRPLVGSGDRSFKDVEITSMRNVIAKRLSESMFSAVHFYVTCEFEVDKLVSARKDLNEMMGSKVSVNDFLIKAMALAVRDVPDVNVAWLGDKIREYNYIDVSVAVATPTGLITPIVKDADLKGLGLISAEMKDLAVRAKDNKLALDEFQGGTLTISNMGMMDVSHFTAVINPPQSIILAVGNAVPVLKPADNEKGFRKCTVMKATLSCDHRTVDGAMGARYMQALRKYIENPSAMMF